MLHAVFHNVIGMMQEAECPLATAFVLKATGLFCEGSSVPLATLRNCMWWMDNTPYTSGELRPHVILSISGGATIGPFGRVRLVADYLYGDERMLGHLEGDPEHRTQSPNRPAGIAAVNRSISRRSRAWVVSSDEDP